VRIQLKLLQSSNKSRWQTGKKSAALKEVKMRLVMPILAATLMWACGDKDEDTAVDTADSADTGTE
jgi:hypothetical protein